MDFKKLVAKRRPPGDRWSPVGFGAETDEFVYESLTDMLQAIYSLTQSTQFYINSTTGEIHIIVVIEDPEPEPIIEKKWSLYGED